MHKQTLDNAPVEPDKFFNFVEPPSDTLLCYFNMFHPAPSPLSLQLVDLTPCADSPGKVKLTERFSQEMKSLGHLTSLG